MITFYLNNHLSTMPIVRYIKSKTDLVQLRNISESLWADNQHLQQSHHPLPLLLFFSPHPIVSNISPHHSHPFCTLHPEEGNKRRLATEWKEINRLIKIKDQFLPRTRYPQTAAVPICYSRAETGPEGSLHLPYPSTDYRTSRTVLYPSLRNRLHPYFP